MMYQCLRPIALLLTFIGNVWMNNLYAQKVETDSNTRVERPAFVSTSFLAGRAVLHDGYLSISNYKGGEWGLMHERMRVLPLGGNRWVMRHRIDASASNAFGTSSNGHLISAMLDYSYGQLYTLRFPCGLTWRTGGEIELSGGALYNPSNSNNPASAKVNLALGFSEMLIYTLHLGRLPVTLRYQLSLPVVSLFFSPGYGESYYEIFYLGNRAGIVKCGSWHNRFDMNNLFTVEIPIGRAALRVGYDNRIRSSRANHLDYFHYSNAFVIGVATSITRLKNSQGATSLSAYY